MNCSGIRAYQMRIKEYHIATHPVRIWYACGTHLILARVSKTRSAYRIWTNEKWYACYAWYSCYAWYAWYMVPMVLMLRMVLLVLIWYAFVPIIQECVTFLTIISITDLI